MNRLSEPSLATPAGDTNLALVPMPSALPHMLELDPAKVVTAPEETTIFRIVKPSVSATKRFPAPSLARPWGKSKSAADPMPSLIPRNPEPAKEVTVRVERTILRIL